jgi:hypothetical protein
MAKVCKVIASCFRSGSPRNNSPPDPLASFNFLKRNIENDKSLNFGVETDVIIINQDTNYEIGNHYLQQTNLNTKNGKLFAETIENTFSPFDAYNYAFQKYKDQYDFWIFSEDDHIIYKENYIADALQEFKDDSQIGFLAFAPISPCPEMFCGICNANAAHSGGGFGLTNTENLLEISEHVRSTTGVYSLPTIRLYNSIRTSEILFTHSFYHIGKQIKLFSKYSCYAVNKEMVADHMVNFRRKICLDNENYFFQVGILPNETW